MPRPPFIITRGTGATKLNTTSLEGRLGLTHKRPSCRPTGTHPSQRSLSAWKSVNKWSSPLSTSRPTLYSVIADGQYHATSLGRNSWKTLIGLEASLQISCNKEGFNAVCSDSLYSKARIGIIGNEQNDCKTGDSRIGFGSGGNSDDSNTCGNVALVSPDNGDKNINAVWVTSWCSETKLI